MSTCPGPQPILGQAASYNYCTQTKTQVCTRNFLPDRRCARNYAFLAGRDEEAGGRVLLWLDRIGVGAQRDRAGRVERERNQIRGRPGRGSEQPTVPGLVRPASG
jgi:hypothetical protein